MSEGSDSLGASHGGESFRRVSFPLKQGSIAGIAFGDSSRAPDILFLHATGFNARTYRALLEPLGERFHVVAIDLRGHGRTALLDGTFGYGSWRRHRDDVIALLEAHFSQPVTLAGHSMGAIVSTFVAARRPDLIGGLTLIEPVILPEIVYAALKAPGGPLVARYTTPIARQAARRRARFASYEQAFAAFKGRGVFKTFPDEALRDYIADGLVREGDGFRLACKPAFEAATFSAHRMNPWPAFQRAPGPIVLLRAEHGSTMLGGAMKRFTDLRPDARVAIVEGSGHMLPIERPDRARAAIESAALMASPTRPFRDLV